MGATKTKSKVGDKMNDLFYIFLILKLCGVINWSWWWVTAPLWIPILLVLIILPFEN
jgi:hypothetical protein